MFVSLQFKLELRKEDREKLIKLMRKQSSAIRTAYNMLKELEKEKTKKPHAQIYHRLRQLFPELPTKYIDSAIYKAKQYPTDKPVVFGSERLFEKLCKNHLSGKAREKLKKQWRELRQGTLIAIGSKHKTAQGNLLLRFMELDGKLHLRITTGNREFIYAKVLREPKSSKDKWLIFMAMLLESWQTKNYFAYTVELKLRDGEISEFALKRYGEREKELRELIEKETNEYKRNALESELRSVENAKKLLTHFLQSLQGEPSSCEGANGRNPEQGRVTKTTLQSAWQALRVALLFPILGKVLPRDLSPLKSVLVEGVWDRVRSRLVPLEVGGTVPMRDF
jgi:predicted transposase